MMRSNSIGPDMIATLRRMSILITCIFFIATSLSGCSFKMRVGNEPDVSALESELIPGVSTPGQVTAVLGRHYGKGQALMPFHDQTRDMLTYYYEEGTMEDDRRIFLFVFLHEGKYEGYMWFSSLE